MTLPEEVNLDEEPISTEIDQSSSNIDQAKSVFETTVVDTEPADFSFKIGEVSSGYGIKRIKETVDQRLARLNREIEELKLEDLSRPQQLTVSDLETTLRALTKNTTSRPKDSIEQVVKDTGNNVVTPSPVITNNAGTIDEDTLTAYDERLTRLETVYIGTREDTTTQPILRQIKQLRQKLAILAMQPDSIATIEKNLAKVSEHVEHIRRASRADTTSLPVNQQIQALYKRLPVLDEYRARLPELLDRLQTLTQIHRDASVVSQTVKDLEHTIGNSEREFNEWKSVLENVQNSITEMQENNVNKDLLAKFIDQSH